MSMSVSSFHEETRTRVCPRSFSPLRASGEARVSSRSCINTTYDLQTPRAKRPNTFPEVNNEPLRTAAAAPNVPNLVAQQVLAPCGRPLCRSRASSSLA